MKNMSEQEPSHWPSINNVGDFVIQAGFVLGPRQIDDFELVYFPDGTQTEYEIGERLFVLNEPCFIFTRPGDWHTYRFAPEKNVRHLFVHFDYASLREADERFEALLQEGHMFLARRHMLVTSLIEKMLWIANHQPAHWPRRLAVLVAAALEELSSFSAQVAEGETISLPVPIQHAITYMEEHLTDSVKIEEIASISGWSHEYFTRMFVAATGISPKRMLLELRFRRAELLMMGGFGTVKQIAYSVGFRDEHHFSKMYKKVRGITASDYIKRCQDPLFRHTVSVLDPYTPYPLNRNILVNSLVK